MKPENRITRKSSPLLSVIVPVYNTERYLNKCLESIQKQTFSNYEVILVNDGSTDRSSSICKKYVQEDDRFLYFEKENGGLFHTRLYGIERISGDFFTFCDSDDYYGNKNAFQIIANTINEKCPSAIQFGFKKKFNHLSINSSTAKEFKFLNRSEFMAHEYPKALCSLWNESLLTTSVWNKVYCRRLADNSPDPKTAPRIFWGEDLILNLHLLNGCDTFCFIPNALYSYRQSSGGTNKFSLRTMQDLDLIKKYQLDFLNEYEGNNKEIIENNLYSEIAGWFYFYIKEALRHLSKEEVYKLIENSLELPRFRMARSYYINRKDDSKEIKLLRKGNPGDYIKEAEEEVNTFHPVRKVIGILKKIYATI